MRTRHAFLLFVVFLALSARAAIRPHRLKINVTDLAKAVAFYCDKLGFAIESRTPKEVVLRAAEVKLVLHEVARLRPASKTETALGFTLQVNDLDRAIKRMKELDIPFAESEPRTEGVGRAISILDPFGRRISLMHQTIVAVAPFEEPRLYNFGYTVPDMDAARAFYRGKLGFVERSERYLPRDMPVGTADGAFAFMLHQRPNVGAFDPKRAAGEPMNVLIYETNDLAATVAGLREAGVTVDERDGVSFRDPFGNVAELVEVRAP